MNGESFVHSILHASQFYDPVKAHEYYEKTKELKGRRTGLKGKRKTEAWAYVKSRIGESKKSDLEKAATTNKAGVEQLRSSARQHREVLAEKFKQIYAQISSNTKDQIAALPEGLSREERKAKVAEIRGQSKTDRASTKAGKEQERDEITNALKDSLDNARSKYKQTRESIKAKYEATLDKEFEAIRTGQF